MICPLCKKVESTLYSSDKIRDYFQCNHCDLLFVPRENLISPEKEKERYELHDNVENDQGYLDYLGKIAESIKGFLQEGKTGLDFGSGRTKNLEYLLKPFHVDSYDIYFYPEESLLQKKYDFVILSEVIEHLRNPIEEMMRLNLLLNSGGEFFIKTKLRPSTKEDFSNWFYKRDITHIEFFSEASLKFLGEILGKPQMTKIGDDLFRLSDH